jgi:hypothetical protein
MIDVHEPANSLLVLSAMAPHGGGASQLDEAQLALLVTWVNRATAEITGHVADSPEPPTPAADSTPGLPEQVQAEPSSSQAESHAPSPADPFDPEIFNRRHTERPRPVE